MAWPQRMGELCVGVVLLVWGNMVSCILTVLFLYCVTREDPLVLHIFKLAVTKSIGKFLTRHYSLNFVHGVVIWGLKEETSCQTNCSTCKVFSFFLLSVSVQFQICSFPSFDFISHS